MDVKRKELLSALQKCMPGVETGAVLLEGADTFIFSDGKILTYNDHVSVTVPFIADASKLEVSDEVLTGAVKAKEFYKLLSKLNNDELKIVQSENSWILKCGAAKAELTLLESTILERAKGLSVEIKEWKPLSEFFNDALQQCQFTSNRSAMSGIILKDGLMMSTDEMRINLYSIGDGSGAFWIAQEAANELMKMTSVIEYGLNNSWVHFRTKDGVVFSCKRLQDEKYPFEKVKSLFESHQITEDDLKFEMPADLPAAAERASVFSTDIDSYSTIQLTFSKEGIEIYSKRSTGKFVEKVLWDKPFEKDFESLIVNVDSAMINYGLKRSRSFAVKQSKMGPMTVSRLLFSGDKIQHLLSTLKQKVEA